MDTIAADNKQKGRELELLPFVPNPERNQEPIQLAHIPPYEYPAPPSVARSSPGDEQPSQEEIEDNDPANWKELRDLVQGFIPRPKERSKPVPVEPYQRPPTRPSAYVPSPKPTKPFLPSRRADPVQLAPVILNHPAQVEPLPYSSRPPAETPNNSVPNKTIRPESPKTIRNNSVLPPNNSEQFGLPPNSAPKTELKKPNETVPLTSFTRVGKVVGRQRKYDQRKDRVNSVRDVILHRHVRGEHYPGLSDDMRRWYESLYFKTPQLGEKPFNANTNYEKHKAAYERGREWIKHLDLSTRTRPLGHS